MMSTRTTKPTKANHRFGTLVALVVALALAAGLLLTQTQKPARAAFPGQNGKTAFVSDRDGNTEIYTMNPDGSGQTNLTKNGNADDAPAFSPDGTKIAFRSSRDGSSQIIVMNADGSDPVNISNNAAASVTNLSPAPNSTTSDRTPTIKATITDRETNLQRSNVKFFLDGRAKTGFAYSASTDRLSLTPGSRLSFGKHTVRIVATDAQGQSTTKIWSFKVTR